MSTNRSSFFQHPKSIWVIISIIALVLLLVIAIPLIMIHADHNTTASPTRTGNQSFHVGTDTVLSIKEQGGNISVYPSQTNIITIQPRNPGTTVIPNSNQVNILYTQTYDAQGHEHLTVTTDPWFRNTDFYVTIPSTTSVQINVSSGSLDIHGGNGLSASTGSGSVAIENIQGPVNVSTDSGDITANNITGPLTVQAESGSIKMGQIHGQIKAVTLSGDVIVQASELSGQSVLQTQNGSVRFLGSIDPKGSYKMDTTSGDVDLTLPANTAFSLNASTGSGSIQNAFGGDVVGGTPQASLNLHTQNGSIVIAQAA